MESLESQPSAPQPVRVLFLCTPNAACSQMAEAFLQHLSQGQVTVFSAGSHPAAQILPEAICAIARLGADMRQHVLKHLDQFCNQSFDQVIVLCDPENESCPTFLTRARFSPGPCLIP